MKRTLNMAMVICVLCAGAIHSVSAAPYEVAAYYFPNYHVDPQNEALFGKDWSEWVLIQAARPRFPGHLQPKVPVWGYEDESDPKSHGEEDRRGRGLWRHGVSVRLVLVQRQAIYRAPAEQRLSQSSESTAAEIRPDVGEPRLVRFLSRQRRRAVEAPLARLCRCQGLRPDHRLCGRTLLFAAQLLENQRQAVLFNV